MQVRLCLSCIFSTSRFHRLPAKTRVAQICDQRQEIALLGRCVLLAVITLASRRPFEAYKLQASVANSSTANGVAVALPFMSLATVEFAPM